MLLFVKPKPQLVQNPLTFEIPTERRTVISNGIHSVESDEETVEIMRFVFTFYLGVSLFYYQFARTIK